MYCMRCLESHVVCGFGFTCCVWVWNHMLCVGLESHFVCGFGITFCVWVWNHMLCVGFSAVKQPLIKDMLQLLTPSLQRRSQLPARSHAAESHVATSRAATAGPGSHGVQIFLFLRDTEKQADMEQRWTESKRKKERGRECVCVSKGACKCSCERAYA